ncbi:transposable element Tcb1 transposase [Trichonephila clavipes]|nr:transposable element Tcb1 transposase [Trichonephila clavipes]
MYEETTDRRGRSHPPRCTTVHDDRGIVRMAVMDRAATLRTIAQQTHHSVSARTNRRRLQQRGMSARHPLLRLPKAFVPPMVRWTANSDNRRHIGPAPDTMLLGGGGIGFYCRIPLVCIDGTFKSQLCISNVLKPVVLTYIQGLLLATFQQDNARPHVPRIVQEFFFIIRLNYFSGVLVLPIYRQSKTYVHASTTRDTPPAATKDQLWQCMEIAWTDVPQGYT